MKNLSNSFTSQSFGALLLLIMLMFNLQAGIEFIYSYSL